MPSQTKTSSNQKIKVGFDLDGVLFFNPLRVMRGVVEFAKKNALHQNTMNFYIPKTAIEQIAWRLIHMSSIKPADGWTQIRKLTDENLIEPYLITARFKCLQNDFDRCLKAIKAEEYFAGCYQNLEDVQPHLFKEKMIKDLGIEYFIEDNWNIVSHLSKATSAQVLWITNVLDSAIQYEPKFNNLEEAIKHVENKVRSS